MALIPFPVELPAPLMENYSFGPYQSFRRVDVSDGPPRYRLNSPNYTSLFNVQWFLTEAEFQTFRIWYEGYAGLNFNRWFTIPLAVGRAAPAGAFPRLLQTLEAHFFEDWEATIDNNSNNWIVSAVLETRYAPVEVGIDEEILDARTVTDAFPTDDVDARTVNDPFPEDDFDGGPVPAFWS